MSVLPIQFNLIETQSYLIVAVYTHYFLPGSLKLHTTVQFFDYASFENIFGSPEPNTTRRWLQNGERPYPGYCRAPGSSICKPALCNCAQLTEMWIRMRNRKKESIKKAALKANFLNNK